MTSAKSDIPIRLRDPDKINSHLACKHPSRLQFARALVTHITAITDDVMITHLRRLVGKSRVVADEEDKLQHAPWRRALADRVTAANGQRLRSGHLSNIAATRWTYRTATCIYTGTSNTRQRKLQRKTPLTHLINMKIKNIYLFQQAIPANHENK